MYLHLVSKKTYKNGQQTVLRLLPEAPANSIQRCERVLTLRHCRRALYCQKLPLKSVNAQNTTMIIYLKSTLYFAFELIANLSCTT